MPPRKNVKNGSVRKLPSRRSARHARFEAESDMTVFNEMLVEAFEENPNNFAPSTRPTKKQKVEEDAKHNQPRGHVPVNQDFGLDYKLATEAHQSSIPEASVPPPPQIVFNPDFSDSDTDESDVEFEDVAIDGGKRETPEKGSLTRNLTDLKVDLSENVPSAKNVVRRRKPVTKAEREFRLHVHKWHLLSLLAHLAIRNQWCDDALTQTTLKKLISRKTISQLHLPETRSQVERKYSFERAIEDICMVWRARWKTVQQGQRRAFWREGPIDLSREVEEASDPIDLEDFRECAKEGTGTRDLGAQLFCALLRSLAVDTRLVCSLQVLPFSAVAKGETPQKPQPVYINAAAQNFGTTSRPATDSKRKKVVESAFPIWWVEVFNPAIDLWKPLDPIVRNTIDKPRTGFEPPGSDNLNAMSYVIAFEDDGTAKDVTKRYASMYNAKTRKTRVESTKGGETWYDGVMQFYQRALPEARDDIEDAALNKRLVQEGMPKNVQDFKGHPVYVLERHLRQNEVLEPKRECGTFVIGSGENQRVESVYRAQDVHICRSADGWYRKGRDVRAGEQPLKHVSPRRKLAINFGPEDEESGNEQDHVALYAEFQTNIYIPPPVIDGRVPRNGYGNLDVYVDSMIPQGAVHIRHHLASQAASILKIDAAEAVTGFKFKGRQGTAVIEGVVVDEKFTAAMIATTTSLQDQLSEDANAQRSAIMLAVWKKMLTALKVRKKIQDEYGQNDEVKSHTEQASDEDDDDGDSAYDPEDGGGFFAGETDGDATGATRSQEAALLGSLKDRAPIILPTSVQRQPVLVVRSPHKVPTQSSDAPTSSLHAGYNNIPSNTASQGVPQDGVDQPMTSKEAVEGVMNGDKGAFVTGDDLGGGFIPSDDVDGGGFFFEENETLSGNPLPRTLAQESQSPPSLLPTENEETAKRKTPSHKYNVQEAQSGKSKAVLAAGEEMKATPQSSSTIRSLPETLQEYTDDVADPSLNALEPSTQTSRSSRRSTGSKRPDMVRRATSDTSMLSHDPDEDDTEPQWLEDAFDDM